MATFDCQVSQKPLAVADSASHSPSLVRYLWQCSSRLKKEVFNTNRWLDGWMVSCPVLCR